MPVELIITEKTGLGFYILLWFLLSSNTLFTIFYKGLSLWQMGSLKQKKKSFPHQEFEIPCAGQHGRLCLEQIRERRKPYPPKTQLTQKRLTCTWHILWT